MTEEKKSFRIGANLCVYLKGSRIPIGKLDWVLDTSFPAGAWQGETETPPYGVFRSRAYATKKEAAERIAGRYLQVKAHIEAKKKIEDAWDAFGPSERKVFHDRIVAEARRIVRKNRTDLGHLSKNRWKSFDLVIRWRRKPYTSGHARGRHKVALTVSPLTPWWEIVWLLTHELAHCVRGTAPLGSGRSRIVHGGPWQSAFCRISEKAHEIDCWSEWSEARVWSRNRGVDRVLRDALKDKSSSLVAPSGV